MRKRIYILQFVICLACVINAQQITLPYQCGFEETENLSEWHIVNPTGATDCWMYGNAAHSEGKRSLYISSDGKTASFGSRPNISVAYMRVKFPTETKQKNYDFSFDWKGGGDINSMLYVMCCPEQFFTQKTQGAEEYYLYDIISSTKGILPNNTKKVCEKLGPNSEDALMGSSAWVNVSLTNDIRISSKNSQLNWVIAFIWVNNNTDANISRVGACIDNIQIASATIRKPSELQVVPVCDDSTMHVTWESASNYFVVEYRKIGSSTWRRSDGLTEGVEFFEKNGTSCSYDLQRVLEGTYDVRVKSALIGGTLNDTSAYAQVNSVIMFCPYNHCINYMDLDNPLLECTYGFTEDGGNKGTPYDNIGYIYVPDDLDKSRHTIMTDPTAVDPETDSLLLCVPPGAIGSVRLGNSSCSYEAESMTYTFSVDSLNAAILIVKYACVLNKPNESCGDPGFKMELFDEQGNPIDNLCGVPDFSYTKAKNSAEWNETKDAKVVWKDWTVVGINLQQYSGQNLKVRFTTRDCGGGGHFGYAYFTLDCASAYIETENCGNDAQIVCEAPEGFAYQWRDEHGTVVCDKKTLEVDAGLHTYTCRVSFIEDTTCYFEVSTTSAPRFPVPQFTTTWKPENCYNRVRFTNLSHVMNKYGGFENHTSEACLDQHWYFTSLTDGSTTETTNYGPLYVVREEGDSILVRLTTYIGENNVCDSTLDTIIYVPSIHSRDSIVRMELCEGSPFLFDGDAKMAERDSVYQKTYQNFAGCDSVFILDLTVHPNTPEIFLRDTSCSSTRYKWNGMYCDSTGHYEAFFQNKWGCDSIVNLDLLITDLLNVQVDSVPYLCADGEELIINFQVYQGVFDSLTIQFDANAHDAGFEDLTITDNSISSAIYPYPADIKPNLYVATLTFYQHASCGNTVFNLPFELRYAKSILEQRWNDVIGIRNAANNGGYEFSEYQWFKDGELIAGATLPYLYVPEGLDSNSDYYVRLTRSSDGAVIYTCSMSPDHVTDKNDMPTLVRPEQKLNVQGKGVARWIDTLGNIVHTQNYDSDSGIVVPFVNGYHTLSTIPDDGPSSARIILIQQN